MTYERQVPGDLDYQLCQYGRSRIRFRGPRAPERGPYLAFLGADETFGRFVPEPYPELIARDLDVACVNLAVPHAGLDLYLNDPAALQVAASAELTVLQVVGAQNMSNRFYRVHPRHNDRFLRASDGLQRLYHEVDFTEFHFITHMLSALHATCQDRFAMVQTELTAAWRARIVSLIDLVGPPVVLLWIAPHSPAEAATNVAGAGPRFVSKDMVDHARQEVAGFVETVVSHEITGMGTEGMVYPAHKEGLAQVCPGPAVHALVAADLAPVIGQCWARH